MEHVCGQTTFVARKEPPPPPAQEQQQQQRQEQQPQEQQPPAANLRPNCHDDANYPDRSDLVWSPDTLAHLDREELDLYLHFASSPCIPGGGCSVEAALELLHKTAGDVKEAMRLLLKLTTNARRLWTLDEVQAFERLQMAHGKNFYLISRDLKTKTVKECVQFFYTWKKSTFRNRYISPTTRKSTAQLAISSAYLPFLPAPATGANAANAAAAAATLHTHHPNNHHSHQSRRAFNGTAALSSASSASSASPTNDESRDSGRGESLLGMDEQRQFELLHALPPMQHHSEPQQDFPCKVCGRVFDRIKSRSAHMKRHKNEAYNR